jgi:hypothetical protein
LQNSLNIELNSFRNESRGGSLNSEDYYQSIIKSIATANNVLPRLKELKKTVTKKTILWSREGKPRGRHNKAFLDYKETKRKFRKEQKTLYKRTQIKGIRRNGGCARNRLCHVEKFWRL